MFKDYRKNGRYRFRNKSAEYSAMHYGHYWTERDVHARLAVLVMKEVEKLSKEKGREVEVHLDLPLKRRYYPIMKGKWLRKAPVVDIVVGSPSEEM